MKIRVLILAILISFLAGCMNGTPSEDDGRKVFRSWLTKKAKIVSFIKTNGKKESFMGVEYYTMYYKAEIVYPEGLNLQCKKFRGKNGMYYSQRNPSAYWSCMDANIKEKGEKKIIKGEISFEKTENGWIGHVRNRYGLF